MLTVATIAPAIKAGSPVVIRDRVTGEVLVRGVARPSWRTGIVGVQLTAGPQAGLTFDADAAEVESEVL